MFLLTIKESLLQFENGTAFVMLQKEEPILEKLAIETGISDGINIEVTSGLDTISKLRAGKLEEEDENEQKTEN